MPRFEQLNMNFYYTGISQSHEIDLKGFYNCVVQYACECVRDVLRTDGTTLTYDAAEEVQNRIKEFFEI